MSRTRCSEGGRRNPRRPYVAMVEGTEHGVPFRIFLKRIDCAEAIAQKISGAVVTCLFSLERRRWVHNGWRAA